MGIHRSRRIPLRGWLLALVVLCLAAPLARVADGVHVALLPDTTMNVAPGDSVLLELYVTEAGAPFNAYETTVELRHDRPRLPADVAHVAAGGHAHEGRLRLHLPHLPGRGRLAVVSHSLLCAGFSLTGPGQLYKLRFLARTW